MKAIESAGGPYLIIPEDVSPLWGANVRKTFSLPDASFSDDYEAAGALTCGVLNPPCSIAYFSGKSADALLISMPFQIAIVQSDSRSVFLAQVEYADPAWSFSSVTMQDFEIATFGEDISFHSIGSKYLLIDAAYLPSEVGDDALRFALIEGDYVFSATFHQPDEQTSLLLYRIIPASSLSQRHPS